MYFERCAQCLCSPSIWAVLTHTHSHTHSNTHTHTHTHTHTARTALKAYPSQQTLGEGSGVKHPTLKNTKQVTNRSWYDHRSPGKGAARLVWAFWQRMINHRHKQEKKIRSREGGAGLFGLSPDLWQLARAFMWSLGGSAERAKAITTALATPSCTYCDVGREREREKIKQVSEWMSVEESFRTH